MGRLLLAVLWVCFVAANSAGAATAERDPLPPEKEGRFPVHVPAYEGVDQILLLSSRWVIVATTNIKEVVAQIEKLSGGKYLKTIATWEASAKAGKPNWTAYKGRWKIRDTHIAKARELAGDWKLGEPAFFAVTSADDPAYRGGKRPRRVGRVPVSLGGSRVRGGPQAHYAHYSYLEMPSPLQNGKTYTVTLGNGKKATFLYDEMRTVSRAIKVNQVGYLPDAAKKYAYLGCHLYEHGPMDLSYAKTFNVVSAAAGKVVHQGAVKLREKNPLYAPRPGKGDDPKTRPPICGEDVYEIDLGGLKEEGEFFISVPGVGRSWTFHHAGDVYGEAFYTAARGLFHQRCGIALDRKHTAWTRVRCHTDPVYECEHVPFGPGQFHRPKGYQIFDVIGATTDLSKPTRDVIGGWHDAADWDRNIYHYSCVFDMLNVYELFPKKFTDRQLNIPESGNGIPDILDEAAFGIEVWKRSMDPRGAVSGMVETKTHPKMDAREHKYAFSRRTRWSSLVYAAAAAQYAHLVKPFDQKKAAEYAASARKAYAFGNDPKNSLGKITIHAKKKRGRGAAYTYTWEEKDEYVWPYLIHAKLRMYVLTGDKTYLAGIGRIAKKSQRPWLWPFRHTDFSTWMYYDIMAAAARELPKDVVAQYTGLYRGEADKLLAMVEKMPYRRSWPRHQDYWMGWGSTVMTNQGRVLLAAAALTGEKKYRDAAILNADFALGANPMGISWTTGLGYVYPIDVQHAISETDGIMDPVPGLTIYGITGHMHWYLRRNIWKAPLKYGASKQEHKLLVHPAVTQVPRWRGWACHPHMYVAQCEFTVHETIASTIFTAACLMPEGWMPSKRLLDRKPRQDRFLFGYWYLP